MSAATSPASAIYYLGPRGTYSHQVAMALRDRLGLPSNTPLIPCPSIAEVYKTAAEAATDTSASPPLALLPFENSTFGPVRETWSLMSANRSELRIVAEHSLSVAHALLVGEETMAELWARWERRSGKRKDEAEDRDELEALGGIERVVSHEQALGQCKRFLMTHISGASIEPVTSTAEGASMAASSSSLLASASAQHSPLTAAVGSVICADPQAGIELSSKLIVARTAIQDRDDNTTRFLLVRPGAAEEDLTAASSGIPASLAGRTNGASSPSHAARSILLNSYYLPTGTSDVDSDQSIKALLSSQILTDAGVQLQLVASRDIVSFLPSADLGSEAGSKDSAASKRKTDLVELAITGVNGPSALEHASEALRQAVDELGDEGSSDSVLLLGVWEV